MTNNLDLERHICYA